MTYPTSPQTCMYCDDAAMYSLIYLEGKKYIPVCPHHEQVARAEIRDSKTGVDDIVRINKTHPPPRTEQRQWSAFQQRAPKIPAPDENSHFGQRALGQRQASALTEAPQNTTLRRTDKDYLKKAISRVWGNDVLVRTDPQYVDKSVARQKAQTAKAKPKTFLQALGTDWTTLRVRKVDRGSATNRLDVLIDGDKYTLYSRKG